jgi:CPA1 family monovalent cation:H+ antiporter
MSAVPPAWFASIFGTLLMALVVALVVRWIRLPYTIALVVVGLVVGWLGEPLLGETVQLSGLLSAEVILFLMLPPLLFEGASAMHITRLKENWRPIAMLAVPGVLLNTVIIAAFIKFLIWPDLEHGWLYALLIGSILAATDPVSVLALVKNLGAPKRLSLLIEGESLFNDGTAVVLFNILLTTTLAVLAGATLDVGSIATNAISSFIIVVLIGALVGFLFGLVVNRILAMTSDHLVEIALTVALAFGTFLVAEQLQGSGVIAVVVAGLLVGNEGVREGMSATAQIGLHHFWEVISFLVNSILFLLVGYELQSIISTDPHTILLAAVAIIAASVARLVVFPLTALSNLANPEPPISAKWQTAMWWGGLRGSIPIALLLLLSHMVHEGANISVGGSLVHVQFPKQIYEDMLVIGFSVVLWTLLVQGLTMKPMMNRLGISNQGDEDERGYEVAFAKVLGSRAALRRISELEMGGLISADDRQRLQSPYQRQAAEAESEMERLADTNLIHHKRVERARKSVLVAQIQTIQDAERSGTISNEVARHVKAELNRALSQSEVAAEKILQQDSPPKDHPSEVDESFKSLVPDTTEHITGVVLDGVGTEEE